MYESIWLKSEWWYMVVIAMLHCVAADRKIHVGTPGFNLSILGLSQADFPINRVSTGFLAVKIFHGP